MASFTERIRLVFDVDNKGATTGFGGFKNSVAGAEGATGKLKAGLTSIGGSMKAFLTSGTGMAVAGGAIAVGLGKAVGAAQELALTVGKLADATGLSTDASSRWVEVADDLGIGADNLTGLIGKLSVNLGKSPADFAALGVETKRAADGTVDMNATLLGAIDRLNAIKDPTERAALAQKLFGKSWKDAAELITAGAANVKKRLDEVSGSKIVDQKKIDDARKFRDVLDNLGDVGEELAVSIGQALIPVLNAVVPVLTDVAEVVGDVSGALGQAIEDWQRWAAVISPAGTFLDEAARASLKAAAATIELEKALQSATSRSVLFGDQAKEAAQAAYDLSVDEEKAAAQAANLARDLRHAQTALDDFQSDIDADESLVKLAIRFRDIADELAEMDTLEAQAELLNLRGDIASTLEAIGGIPPETVIKIASEFDPDNWQATWNRIAQLRAFAEAGIDITVNGPRGTADSFDRKLKGSRAGGGPVTAGGAYLVGELGPEIVNIPGGSNVIPNNQLGGTGDQTIVVQLMLDGKAIQSIATRTDALRKGTT